MATPITATEVRHRFPEIVRRVAQGASFVVIARSRPVFRIVPLAAEELDERSDWLGRVKEAGGSRAPSTKAVNEMVHRLRRRPRRSR